ncbi:uncharacterized protein LOC143245598 [Tachypleus tridentatus]|uniref:uncharacterized protein LOC143245598 n=1 Tax=Tachypleus tridentatus TaxID=6853 RepID=UPI003FD27415
MVSLFTFAVLLEFHCPSSDGYFPHERDCTKYYICKNNIPYPRTCVEGLFYNDYFGTCEKEVDCGNRSRQEEFHCPSSDGYFPHERDCTKYYICKNNIPYPRTCVEGLFYNDYFGTCEKEVDCGNRSRQEEFHCPSSDGYFPHERDCTKYYICKNNIPYPRTCVEGLFYNDYFGTCEKEVDCGNRSRQEEFHCPSSDGYFPHERDCTKYYICKNNIPYPRTCVEGLFYNDYFGTCEKEVECGNRSRQEEFHCPSSDGYFPHERDCTKYYICKNNIPYPRTCVEGLFYNDYFGTCEKEVECGNRSRQEEFHCPSSDGYFPHERDCTKYYICKNNIPYPRTCVEGLFYNDYFGTCEKEVECGNRSRQEEFHCPSSDGYFPHERDCTKYYICKTTFLTQEHVLKVYSIMTTLEHVKRK